MNWKVSNEKALLLACTGMLSAYVFSVTVYKIWYLAIIPCGAVWARTSWVHRDKFSVLLTEILFGALYWIAILASVAANADPVASYSWVFIDLILLPVFVLFLTAAMFNSPVDTERYLRLVIWTSLISVLYFWDGERVATRAWWIVPFIVPFCVAASLRGERMAYIEIVLSVVMMFLTATRVPFAVTVFGAAATVLLLKPPLWRFVRWSSVIGAVTVTTLIAAMLVPTARERVLFSFDRMTGLQSVQYLVSGSEPVPAPPMAFASAQETASLSSRVDLIQGTDEARVKISAVVSEVFAERGISMFGIGYGKMEREYARRYPTDYEVYGPHNIFVAWALEIGLFGLAVTTLLLARFFWLCRQHFSSPHFRCLAVAMVGMLMNGILHPVHHGPMLFAVLGLCYGGARRMDMLEAEHGCVKERTV